LSLPGFDKNLFHNVLDILNVRAISVFATPLDDSDFYPPGETFRPLAIVPTVNGLCGLENGIRDFISLIGRTAPVSLYN